MYVAKSIVLCGSANYHIDFVRLSGSTVGKTLVSGFEPYIEANCLVNVHQLEATNLSDLR